MTYIVVDLFDKGIKRHYVHEVHGNECSREIGPFTLKYSAVKCAKGLRMNDKIMALVRKHEFLADEDEEKIFEVLECWVDGVSE